jgi:hypothetical protein
MIDVSLDTANLGHKLSIFTSELGGIGSELLARIGKQMTSEAKSRAPFGTGELQHAIKFIAYKNIFGGALTTKKNLNDKKQNIFYAWWMEHGADIRPSKKKYLRFKIDGEWKRVTHATIRPRPYMQPVVDEYFGSETSIGYSLLAKALHDKMNEELGK